MFMTNLLIQKFKESKCRHMHQNKHYLQEKQYHQQGNQISMKIHLFILIDHQRLTKGLLESRRCKNTFHTDLLNQNKKFKQFHQSLSQLCINLHMLKRLLNQKFLFKNNHSISKEILSKKTRQVQLTHKTLPIKTFNNQMKMISLRFTLIFLVSLRINRLELIGLRIQMMLPSYFVRKITLNLCQHRTKFFIRLNKVCKMLSMVEYY